ESGRIGTLGKRVWGNSPWVRIPLPPHCTVATTRQPYTTHTTRSQGQTVRVDEAERRAQIRRFWEYAGRDQDVSHEIYHDDAVLEFPQSGERFEGVANFKEW